MSALNVCKRHLPRNRILFFPCQIYRCVTTNISAIKPQSGLNPSYIPKGSFGGKVYCNRTFIKIVLTVLANRLFCNWLGFSRAQFCKRSATIPRYVANKCHERNAIFGTVFLRIFFITAISGRWQLFYFLFVCLFL